MSTQAKDKELLETAFFKIDVDGAWHHNGAPIRRAALAKLFADKGLKMDADGQYWLQSPYEEYPVDVSDVPFIITQYIMNEGAVDLETNMGDIVALGPEQSLELRYFKPQDMKLPYVHVRDGLYARLGRNVFHELAHKFGVSFESRGTTQILGEV